MESRRELERAWAQALAKAIEIAGGPTNLAKGVGVSKQAVDNWTRVPSGRCLKVEEVTGVSRYEQRPDIYGRAPKKKDGRPTKRAEARAA